MLSMAAMSLSCLDEGTGKDPYLRAMCERLSRCIFEQARAVLKTRVREPAVELEEIAELLASQVGHADKVRGCLTRERIRQRRYAVGRNPHDFSAERAT
jgi:hypothetical protein